MTNETRYCPKRKEAYIPFDNLNCVGCKKTDYDKCNLFQMADKEKEARYAEDALCALISLRNKSQNRIQDRLFPCI